MSKSHKKGKHFQISEHLRTKKALIFFIILLVLIVSVNLVIILKNNNIDLITQISKLIEHKGTKLNEPYEEEPGEIIINTNENIAKNKTVENADFLEITGLDMQTQSGFSSVTTSIKNNSKETLKNFSLTIQILDESGNTVAELSNPIEQILPDQTIESFGVVNKDISDTYDYIVKKN